MSYCAFVPCSCYHEGKTSTPPYPEYVEEENGRLFLDIPNELFEKDWEKAIQMEEEFDQWKKNACPHEDMELAFEQLTNIMGMNEFRSALEKYGGKKKFPVLLEYLPKENSGILPANLASKALNEINEFEKNKKFEKRILLIDETSGKLVALTRSDTYVFFGFAEKFIYGLDKKGFFILERVPENGDETLYVVFRSKKFYQQYHDEDKYLFVDQGRNYRFVGPMGLVFENEEIEKTYHFVIKKEKVKVSEFYTYITRPLKRILEISITSGNPVHWC